MYDSEAIGLEELAETIEGLGYEARRVAAPSGTAAGRVSRAVVPAGAPGFFAAALERARRAGKPVVIDFWATWCVPCLGLKKKTFQDPGVKALLDKVELVLVDLDEHPQLAEAYGVSTVPDVFFIDREGRVVDRLKDFEAAGPFAKRLAKLLGK